MDSFIKECGDLIIEHNIGSELIDNRSESSDYDTFKIHKTRLTVKNIIISDIFPDLVNFGNVNWNEPMTNNNVLDVYSIDFLTLISFLIDRDSNYICTLSHVLSHLYAVKFKLINSVYDENIYNFYLDWLNCPGSAYNFWHKLYTQCWLVLRTLPDKNYNWSQQYNESEQHRTARDDYSKLKLHYPVVDKTLGYDPIVFKKSVQDMIIAIAILTGNPVSEQDKNLLKDIKNHAINFNEYQILKIHIWRRFRIAFENSKLCYFLGYGGTIAEGKKNQTYGMQGLTLLINMVSNL